MAGMLKAACAMLPLMLFAPSADALLLSASNEPDDADALTRESDELMNMERQGASELGARIQAFLR